MEEVLMEVEVTLNNRLLPYVQDTNIDRDIQILTPNAMIHGPGILELEEDVSSIEEKDLRKRARYIQKCKNLAWQIWATEYFKELREYQNPQPKAKKSQLSKGDVVLIQGIKKNRGRWNIRIVMKLNRSRTISKN